MMIGKSILFAVVLAVFRVGGNQFQMLNGCAAHTDCEEGLYCANINGEGSCETDHECCWFFDGIDGECSIDCYSDEDCNGVLGGYAVDDACGVCDGDGSSCASTCNEYDSSITAVYDGYAYQTITGFAKDSTINQCEETFTALSAGFEISPYSDDILENVVRAYPWNTGSMVIHVGGAWHTGNEYDQDKPEWVIETDGATYKTPVCKLAILVRKYCDGQFTDCNGVIDGPASPDLCGVCGGTNECFDCNGVLGGSAVDDACGVCDGDGSSCETTEAETTEASIVCEDFNEKKPCRKETEAVGLQCTWYKHIDACKPNTWVPICSDYDGEKKVCRKMGCFWDKHDALCHEEEPTEPPCSDQWAEVAALKQKDGKIKHKGIFSIEDCVNKAKEIGAEGIIYDLVNSKGICLTYGEANFAPGVSSDVDEAVWAYGCM